jgi:hypothetical protein
MPADPGVVQQRVIGGLGMLFNIPRGVKIGMRVASFGYAVAQIVQQRELARARHVFVRIKIPVTREESVR